MNQTFIYWRCIHRTIENLCNCLGSLIPSLSFYLKLHLRPDSKWIYFHVFYCFLLVCLIREESGYHLHHFHKSLDIYISGLNIISLYAHRMSSCKNKEKKKMSGKFQYFVYIVLIMLLETITCFQIVKDDLHNFIKLMQWMIVQCCWWKE